MPQTLTRYPTLLKAVRSEIDKGQTIIERQQGFTSGNVGKYISDYIFKGEQRFGNRNDSTRKTMAPTVLNWA